VCKLRSASRLLSARPIVPVLGVGVTVLFIIFFSTFILKNKVHKLNSEAKSTIPHKYD
jgi:hypothetical protein